MENIENNLIPILIVDDDTSLLKLLSIRLSSEGYDVSTATSVDDAIRLISDHKYSALLSDLRMPGKDGLYLLDYVSEHFPSLPVILITAHGSISEAVIATEKGALGFITKPIEHEKLREALKLKDAMIIRCDDMQLSATKNKHGKNQLKSLIVVGKGK